VNVNIEMSIYDQDLGMSSEEWTLFGGQLLLTTPETPACFFDLGQHVLRGGADGSTGGQSPVDDIPQDSIWADAIDGMTSDQFSLPFLQKESHLHLERTLDRSSSSDEAFFLYEDGDDTVGDITSSYQSSLDSTHSIGSSPIHEIISTYLPDIPALWDQHDGDKLTPYACKPGVQHDTFDDLFSFQDRLSSHGVLQKVPSGSALDLLTSADLKFFDANDPVSVCKLLKLLGDDIDVVPPPMSPEDVDNVLLQDSAAADDVVLVASPRSVSELESIPASVLSNPASPSSSWSGDYGQTKLKIDKGRSHAVSREPYPTDRKLKKKEQNKTAAQRYREKKREEKGVVKTEVEILEEKNAKLKSRADDLTREINYLRSLLDEIKRQ